MRYAPVRYAPILIAALGALLLFPGDRPIMVLLLIGVLACGVGLGGELAGPARAAAAGERSSPPVPVGNPPPQDQHPQGTALRHRAPDEPPGHGPGETLPVPRQRSEPPHASDVVSSGQDPTLHLRDPAVPSGPPPAPPVRPKSQGGPILPGEFPLPPLFAGYPTTRAHSSPWHLPERPVQPALAADDASLGGLGVLAASIVGTGHRCAEPAEPRQDAYRIARDEEGRHLIIAVADGISSCRFSDLGATVAVTTAVNTARRMLAQSRDPARLDAAGLYTAVAQRMRAAAKDRGIGQQDVGAVLLVAVVPTEAPAAGAPRTVWMSWVGDVSAWQLYPDLWDPIAGDSKERGGDVQSGEIDAALPWAPQAVQHGVLELPAGGALAFVSDGVGDAFHLNGQVNRHFARAWAHKPALTSFINDMSFDAPSCQDDRTAVVVWTDR